MPEFFVPVDANGKPLAIITVSCSEKVGLPNYSNVDVGPVTLTRFVEDDPQVREQAFADGMREVEKVVAVERGHVLAAVGQQIKSGS